MGSWCTGLGQKCARHIGEAAADPCDRAGNTENSGEEVMRAEHVALRAERDVA